MASPFASAETAEVLRKQLVEEADPHQRLMLRPMLAMQLLNAGKSEEALELFDQFRNGMEALRLRFDPQMEVRLTMQRALCFLRLGEQENCLATHTCDSCLFPIQGGGVHQIERGSRGAIEVLSARLRSAPDDLQARWLLNIAHMTLGEYPDRVEPAWLIAPRTFASEYDIKRFRDVAGAVGLDVKESGRRQRRRGFRRRRLSRPHALVLESCVRQLRLFHNKGDGTFTERTEPAGLEGLVSGLNLMQTDYNNDGAADVFILRGAWLRAAGHYPNSLLRNNGDGTFTDVTEEAGLLSFHPTQTAVWFDFNSDGWLDVFIGNEFDSGRSNPCELFRNNGDGTFTECGAEAGVAAGGSSRALPAAISTATGDPICISPTAMARISSFATTAHSKRRLPRSPWKFTDVTAEAGVNERSYSFPTWFWD